MKNFAMKLKRFLKSEDGPTAVEYAVMLSLIIVVCITAVTSIGKNAATTFTNVANQLGTSSELETSSRPSSHELRLALFGSRGRDAVLAPR